MGGVAASLGTSLGSALIGKAFGGGSKDSSAVAAGNNAPVMTPEQQDASKTLLPKLKNWMTEPPKIQTQKYQPSNIIFGGSGPLYQQGSWSQNKDKEAWQNQLAEAQRRKKELEAMKSQEQSSGNQNATPPSQTTDNDPMWGGSWQRPQQANVSVRGNSIKQSPFDAELANKEISGIDQTIADLEAKLKSSPDQTYTPGTLNLPNAPDAERIQGKFGGFQPGKDYTSVLSSIMAPIDKQASGYSNENEGIVADRLKQNMNSKLQEGYDASYLKNLYDAGINPLNTAYDKAMHNVADDMNRMGLSGSGFELERKFGKDDSVTANYLKNVQDLERGIALQGAEAARQDRLTNANLQNQALSGLQNLSGNQSADQLRRLQTDIGVDTTNRDLLRSGVGLDSSLNQQNESNRQWWANKDTGDTQYDNAQNWQEYLSNIDLGKWLAGRDDSAQQYNLADDKATQQANIGYDQQGISNLLNFIGQQSSAANNAQQNYWNAYQANQNQNAQNNSNASSIATMLMDAYNKSQAPVQSNAAQQTFLPTSLTNSANWLKNLYNSFGG